jgi:hypothetical protein
MTIEKQCAKLDVMRHDLNQLLIAVYKCAARLSEHPDHADRLNLALCNLNATLRNAGKSLVNSSKEFVAMADWEIEHSLAWEPPAYAELLEASHAEDLPRLGNASLSHSEQPDQLAHTV